MLKKRFKSGPMTIEAKEHDITKQGQCLVLSSPCSV